MDTQIAVLSGLLIGIVLAVAVSFFILWRFQRLYDMMTILRLDMRNFLITVQTKLVIKPEVDVKVELMADLEQHRIQLKKATDILNKVMKNA